MSCLYPYRFNVARLFFGLYLAVLVNGVVFRHAHRLADGTIICHAHPYKSSPGTQSPNHAHSRDELIWLDAFTNALYANPGLVVWTALVALVALLITGRLIPTVSFWSFSQIAFWLRGPPVLLV